MRNVTSDISLLLRKWGSGNKTKKNEQEDILVVSSNTAMFDPELVVKKYFKNMHFFSPVEDTFEAVLKMCPR